MLKNSGRLALKEVKTYDIGFTDNRPSFQFTYTTNNPDHEPDAYDFWGYHKDDFSATLRDQYNTFASQGKVDAWNLKTITTPLGGTIDINLESDEYELVSGNEPRNLGIDPLPAQRIFPITSLPSSNNESFANAVSTAIGLSNDNLYDFINDHASDIEEVWVGVGCLASDNIGINGPSCYNITSGMPNCADAGGRMVTQNRYDPTTILGYFNGTHDVLTVLLDYEKPDCNNNFQGACWNHWNFRLPDYSFVTVKMKSVYGGGLRVKDIVITEGESGHQYRAELEYHHGKATNEPDKFQPSYYDGLNKASLLYDRHFVTPRVGYDSVLVIIKNNEGTSNGKREYMFSNVIKNATYYTSGLTGLNLTRDHYYEDRSSTYGRLRSSRTLNSEGQTLNKTVYQYQEGGYITDLVHVNQDYTFSGNTYSIESNYRKVKYSYILKRMIQYQDGINTTTEYDDFDTYTGSPMKITSFNPLYGKVINESSSAHYQTGYEAMGSAIESSTNHNLLNASYESSSALPSGEILSKGRQEWSSSRLVRTYNATTGEYENASRSLWTPKDVYSHIDDPVAGTSDRYEGEVTLYDKWNHVLEQKNESDRFAASKYGYDERYPIASAADCNYASFSATSFEDQITQPDASVWNEGEVTRGDLQWEGSSGVVPHTGKKLLRLLPGTAEADGAKYIMKTSTGDNGLITGRTYIASVWIHYTSHNANAIMKASLNGTVNGSAYSQSVSTFENEATTGRISKWLRLELRIDVPDNFVGQGAGEGLTLTLYNTDPTKKAYFDDLRIHPIDVPVTTNVYDEHTGLLTHTLDNNNFFTRFEYDGAGRVIRTYREMETGVHLVTENEFNFARP